jgi:hypothetical protein
MQITNQPFRVRCHVSQSHETACKQHRPSSATCDVTIFTHFTQRYATRQIITCNVDCPARCCNRRVPLQQPPTMLLVVRCPWVYNLPAFPLRITVCIIASQSKSGSRIDSPKGNDTLRKCDNSELAQSANFPTFGLEEQGSNLYYGP